MQDVAIIGGGAAGLCLSVMLKQKYNCSVIVFEAADRVGKKLALTGNGRCNISNVSLAKERYHGDSDFAFRVIENFDYSAQESFFKELGVPFCTEEGGKAYPMSLQAASVVDALRFRAEELGVKLFLNSKVTAIARENNGFKVFVNNKGYDFKTVVIATGGAAGGKLGSTDGYAFLKAFGHKIESTFPSIVQIKTPTDIVKQLKGVKVVAGVTAISDIGTRTDFGEVLFCDYGLSGPPILQVSRLVNGKNSKIVLDLMPKYSAAELNEMLLKRCEDFPNRLASELFTGLINKRLGQVMLKIGGGNLNIPAKEISANVIAKTVQNIKGLSLNAVGTTGFENAQVTAGGVQCAQFFDHLMSKKVKGLFAVGEVLDVDGDCGGFNLAFAWASAFAASNGIIDFLKKQDSK